MLKAKDIWDGQQDRRRNRMAAMAPIIIQIQNRIKIGSIHNVGSPCLIYEVPSYVFGYPLYQMKEALEYLVSEFSKAGYSVWIVEKNCLLISWIKPITSRERNPVLTTNYRPMVYDTI